MSFISDAATIIPLYISWNFAFYNTKNDLIHWIKVFLLLYDAQCIPFKRE